MGDDSLDALLSQIRSDLDALEPPQPAPRSRKEPAPEPAADTTLRQADSANVFDEEDQAPSGRRDEAPPPAAPAPARDAVWSQAAHAAALALAASGAFFGINLLLGAGLVAHLAAFLFFPQTQASGDTGALAARLDRLEERLSAIHMASRDGVLSKQLEEEIQETRRILIDLVRGLERSRGR